LCYFYYTDVGIHFDSAGSTSIIRDSRIGEDESTAIYCNNASSPLIDSNFLGFNGSGIYCTNSSSPVIQGNSIQASGFAITAESGSYPDVGHSSPTGGQSPGNNNIA